jgi:hypothetical protein
MEIEDEDDEGASDSGSGGRQSGVAVDRQDGDRQGGDSEGNSRATSRQRLGGGGKAGVLTWQRGSFEQTVVPLLP